MILDLTNVPFTRRNSYMVISYITDQFRLSGIKIEEDEGLYLRSVRGDCRMNPLISHLVPTYRGKAADYTYYSDGTEIVVEFKAADAKIEIIFAEENTLLIRGQGEGIGLEFDRLAGAESLSLFLTRKENSMRQICFGMPANTFLAAGKVKRVLHRTGRNRRQRHARLFMKP